MPVKAGSRTSSWSQESKTGSLSSWRSRLYASGSALSVARRPVRLPMRRPDLPRASSAMSGFFFCGMIDEPVEKASWRVTKENSFVFHRMISSATRDRLTPIIAVTKANSATKSREAVPSIELATEPCSKPRSAATASGSRPSEDPASAPEPYGDTAVRSSHCRSRSASLARGWTWARTWCAKRTGWACWRWVRPGIATSGCASARPTRASCSSAIRPPMIRAWSRRYMRKSVAIWSLRERPARSLPPRSGPTRSSRPRSSAVCTSSSATVPVKLPSATSAASLSSPSCIRVSSSAVSRPAPCSTRAWAREPAMSYGARRQSKCTEAESFARASAGPAAKRPPQSRTSPLLLLTAVLLARHDRTSYA